MSSVTTDGYRIGIFTEDSRLWEFQSRGYRKEEKLFLINLYQDFFHWNEKLSSLAVPSVREPWQKVVIIGTGFNFTFFVVF